MTISTRSRLVSVVACVFALGLSLRSTSQAQDLKVPSPADEKADTAPQSFDEVLRDAATVPACCPARPRPALPTITDIVVLVDSTVSMAWPSGRESRLSIAQWLSLDVADLVPDRIPAAFVSLFDEASEMRQLAPFVGDERTQLRRTVMRLHPTGDGKLDKLLGEASRLLSNRPNAVPLIILVTDGVDCDPFSHGAPIRQLHKDFGERLHFQVIGICDNTIVSAKLRDLANQAGTSGDFTSVKSSSELSSALTRTRSLIDAVWKQRREEAKWCAETLYCCLRELKSTTDKLTARIDELNKEVQELTTRNEKLGDEVHNLEQKNAQLNVNVQKLTDEKAALKRDVTRIEAEKLSAERDRDLFRQLYVTWFWLALASLVMLLVVLLLSWFRIVRLRDRLKQQGAEIGGLKDQLRDREEQLACCRRELNEVQCQLKAAEAQHHADSTTISELRTDLCRLKDQVSGLSVQLEEKDGELRCCQHHLEELKCQLKAAESQNKSDTTLIAELRSEKARLEVLLNCCKESGERMEEELCGLRAQLAAAQGDLVRAQQGLHDASQTIQQQQASLTRLTGECAAATAQANQLNLRVQELHCANVHLQAQLSECKTGRAAADERALGATREMAANKKDCCCPPSAPVISYNTPQAIPSTPSTPTTAPVAGSPPAVGNNSGGTPAVGTGTASPAGTPAVGTGTGGTPAIGTGTASPAGTPAVGTAVGGTPAVGTSATSPGGSPAVGAGPGGSPGVGGAALAPSPNAGASGTAATSAAADADAESTANPTAMSF